MGIRIFSDSSCDLPKEMIEKHNIGIVPFMVSYGDDKYYKEYYELTNKEFYHNLRTRECRPKTSMPSSDAYYEYFEPAAKNGDDIICFSMTSKFSGSYSGAAVAAEEIKEKYPDIKIKALDSYAVTVMTGFLVKYAAEMNEEGKSFEDIIESIENDKFSSRAVITVDSLIYLQRGGRIGKASSLAGELLNVKPIIKVDDGELIPHSKIRTRKKAIARIVEVAREMTENYDISKTDFYIIHSEPIESAYEAKALFEAQTGVTIKYEPFYLGCTVGAHVGPTVVGIGFTQKDFKK